MTGYGDLTPDWEALFKAFLAFAEYDTGSNWLAMFETYAGKHAMFETNPCMHRAFNCIVFERKRDDDLPF
jgi:hypothetical protein